MIPFPAAAAAAGRDPHREGVEACAFGLARACCPYVGEEAAEWLAGWDEERALEGAPA
jgi:ribosome modulation factor